MSTNYYVICEECKITRPLDKLHGSHWSDEISLLESESVKFANEIQQDAYKAYWIGVLLNFMAVHKGHRCRYVDEHWENV
jgi:hypothetical protein